MSGEDTSTAAAENIKEDSKGDVIETTPPAPFCIEILPIIKNAQNQHGLRHGDYQRYRVYCTRRLRRVRKAVLFTQSQGHRNRYLKKTLTPQMVTNAHHLFVPLVSAERAWALGMELKQDTHMDMRKKFHLLRRLRKALKHACDLVVLCEQSGRFDDRTLLEVQAYQSWILGNLKFEHQKWQEALDAFGRAQTIYEKLSGVVPQDQRVVYTQRVEEITPNVRYCAYNIGGLPTDITQLMKLRRDAPGFDMLASKIDSVLMQTQEKAASSLTEVTWQGKQLPVKSPKLRVSLVKVHQLVADLGRLDGEEERLATYDKLLVEVQNALQIAHDDLSNEVAAAEKKHTLKADTQLSILQSLEAYLTHFKLTHTISRNLFLLDTMRHPKNPGAAQAKPEKFVMLYDNLLQNALELAEISSVERDTNSQKELGAQTFTFKAYRCYHLSESYAAAKKWAESIALFDRALSYVSQAQEHYREWGQPAMEAHLAELQKLQDLIRGKKCEVHVSAIFETKHLDEKMMSLTLLQKPLTEQLDEFVAVPSGQKVTLAPIPPDYRPVPCKPRFFDLAHNHVKFPSLEQRMEKKAGGIKGFVQGLIWKK